MISIKPITPTFVAEIGNVDLGRLTDAVFAEIEAAFNRYAVLVFHNQPITEEQQLAFAKHFGELEFSPQPFVQTPGGKLTAYVMNSLLGPHGLEIGDRVTAYLPTSALFVLED